MKWHEAPLLPLAAAFALGIYASSWAAVPTSWLLGGGGVLLLLTAVTLALGGGRVATVGLLVLASALGALRAARDPLPAHHIARAPAVPRRCASARSLGSPRKPARHFVAPASITFSRSPASTWPSSPRRSSSCSRRAESRSAPRPRRRGWPSSDSPSSWAARRPCSGPR